MKHIKNFLYIFAVGAVVGIVLFISTVIVQLGTEAIVNAVGLSLKDDLLFSISGGLGTAITGTLCAVYVKKKNYTACVEVKEPFRIKKCLYFSALAGSICSILFYAITTVLFVHVLSLTDEVHVIVEKSLADIFLTDIFFPILIAPIFEELLFRMGLYSLMRQRFGKKSSIVICTLVFAAMHGYSIQGFCSCLTGGLLFMLIYISTGNIWYSIIAHMVCNIDASILNALEDKGVTFLGIPVQYEMDGFNMVHPMLVIMATIFCAVCIIKKTKNAEKQGVYFNKRREG